MDSDTYSMVNKYDMEFVIYKFIFLFLALSLLRFIKSKSQICSISFLIINRKIEFGCFHHFCCREIIIHKK
jgi:hypothetical protein